MNMDQENEAVRTIMKNASGNVLDIYYTILTEYLLKSAEPEAMLATVLSTPRQSAEENAGPSARVEDSVRQEVEGKYGVLLDDIVKRQMEGNPDQQVFYKKLYNVVFRSGAFPEDAQTQAVLLYMLSEENTFLPYFPTVNLLSMDNEEFQAIIKQLLPQLQQAVHMLNRHFKSRTEEASQLWEISQQLEPGRDQIVYWAALLALIRNSFARKISEENEGPSDTE